MNSPVPFPALRILLGQAGDGGATLGELAGNAVVSHLRYKPGRSVIGRLVGSETGWVAGFGPRAAHKAAKLREKAAGSGYTLLETNVPGAPGHVLLAGPVGLDNRLRAPLHAAGLLDARGRPSGTVLNYNPWRRLVGEIGPADLNGLPRGGTGPDHAPAGGLSAGRFVAKTTSTGQPRLPGLLGRLAEAGVPVLVPRPGADPRTLIYPHYGYADLAGSGQCTCDPDGHVDGAACEACDPASGAEAGAVLARLHGIGVSGGEWEPGVQRRAVLEPWKRVSAVVSAIAQLVPGAARDARSTARTLLDATAACDAGGWAVGLLHGDFSADQLLVGANGLRLIDLDRIAWGPAGWDLGCFAAADLLAGCGTQRAENVVAGYRAVRGGAGIAAAGIRAWTGLHVLLRAVEPFRAAQPGWEDGIAERIRTAGWMARP